MEESFNIQFPQKTELNMNKYGNLYHENNATQVLAYLRNGALFVYTFFGGARK